MIWLEVSSRSAARLGRDRGRGRGRGRVEVGSRSGRGRVEVGWRSSPEIGGDIPRSGIFDELHSAVSYSLENPRSTPRVAISDTRYVLLIRTYSGAHSLSLWYHKSSRIVLTIRVDHHVPPGGPPSRRCIITHACVMPATYRVNQ
jgi:hypothetical protein